MTLKKFATGSGKAGKNGMIAYACNIIGRVSVDDNEADAVAVCMWGMDKRKEK
jgi:Holliday junction resolvasome RuvABC endonuclease subunit